MTLPNNMQRVVEQRERIENGFWASMIPRALRSLAWEQKAAEATQSAAHRALFRDEGIQLAEGDDVVNVDSPTTTHNHYYPLPPSPASPLSPTTQAGLGKLAKAGIAAALIASGGGAAVGVPLLIETLMNPSEPVPVVQPAEKAGVRFELGRD